MKVTDIKRQPLDSVLDNFCICQNCHIVDRDQERVEVGHPCATCGEPSPSGRSYFHSSVRSLINLMQEFYHARYRIGDEAGDIELQDAHNSELAVVIFFASLREVLLVNFIKELLNAYNVPDAIYKHLLSDSRTYSHKMTKLFPALVGVPWKKAIEAINESGKIDYEKLDRFVVRIAEARNTFLHDGIKYAIDKDMPGACLENISPLLNLYVALHNTYVFPIYQQKRKPT